MILLPVATREVREASRQSRTYAWRWITAAVALALMAFIAWVTRHSGSQGQELFVAVSIVAYIYCLLAGVVRTADVIAQEKRDNTLGLLFLTDLKGWDIILGKLLSSSINCIFGLLALVPMLAIPMLMGGVPWSEFLRVILSLFVALLLSISWGFVISSIFRLSVVTISMGLAIIIAFAAGFPLFSIVLAEGFDLREVANFTFVFSPTYSLIFGLDATMPNFRNHYWKSVFLNIAIAIINLRLAIFFLPCFWQEVPKNKNHETWRNRIRVWRFGKGAAKKRFRTRLLNQNPFFWLANREQISSLGLMITSMVILILGLVFGLTASRNPFQNIEDIMAPWMFGCVIVNIIVAFRMAMSASYRLADDRRSGALELLLGTEVSVKELLRGYWMALGRQFFGPIAIVLFAGFFAMLLLLLEISHEFRVGDMFQAFTKMFASLFIRAADSDEALVFLLVISIQLMLIINWFAVIWVGLWLGLRERRSGFATWATLTLVYVPPWALFIVGLITVLENDWFRGLPEEIAIPIVMCVGWIFGLTNAIGLSLWARRNLLRRFREAAADRYMGPRKFPWPTIRRVAIRFAAAGACLVLLLVVARYFVDRSGDKAWQAALAKYPQFKLKQDPPRSVGEAIPDAQNLAKAPLLLSFTAPGRSRLILPWNLSAVATRQYNEDHLPWSWPVRTRMNLAHVEQLYTNRKVLTNIAETPAMTVLTALTNYDAVLDELHAEAAARTGLQYQIPAPSQQNRYYFPAYYYYYDPGGKDIRPAIRQLIQTLGLRTSANLAVGNTNTADLFLALRLARGFTNSPENIVQFNEMTLDTAQPVYDGLTRRAWDDATLARIQETFSSIDFLRGYQAFCDFYIREVLRNSEDMLSGRRDWSDRQAPTGFRRKWQAETLHWGMDTLPKIVDVGARRIDVAKLTDLAQTRPALPQGRHQPDQVAATIRGMAFAQTTANQIILACAIERFRNGQNRVPENLAELVPKYVTAIPTDLFTGQPLHYKPRDGRDNYLIYSVGPDGADNNAQPQNVHGAWTLWHHEPGTDWVWNSNGTDTERPEPRQNKKRKR